MIKQYTTKPLAEHDADYPWYRPGFLPANTCDYPYHFPYFNSYPTYTVTTDFDESKCNLCLELKKYNKDHKKHHSKNHSHNKHHDHSHKDHSDNKHPLVYNLFTVFMILLFVYILANLVL